MEMSVSAFHGLIISLIAFNLAASLLLLFFPGLLMKVNNLLSKWVSTSKFDEAMNRRHDIDQALMGLRRVFGIISLLFSIALIYFYIRL
jgi:putative exporter of polyketide antibiotics